MLFSQSIAAGAAHSLTLCDDSTVWAWGLNNFGQLGDSTNTDKNIPVPVKNLRGVIAIASSGIDHSYALKKDGTVWAWGINSSDRITETGMLPDFSIDFQAGIETGLFLTGSNEASHES